MFFQASPLSLHIKGYDSSTRPALVSWHLLLQELRPDLLQELSLNACLNGKAFLIEHGELLEFVGNRTECALLVLARKWGINYQKVRASVCGRLLLAQSQLCGMC